MGEYTYYTFQHGNTYHYNDPNATYFYLYLDQATINKAVEIPPENVFKISDLAINVPFYKTDVTRVAGKTRKSKKSRKPGKPGKTRKPGKKIRHKKKSRY